ncbi:MAG: putative Ig domain-containing protein [bacterium]|nr:putative Ig domain-containing protein [bacterium]
MNAELIATLAGILALIAFWVMVVGLFKPSWVIRRPSLQTRKGVFFVWGIVWLCLGGLSLIVTQYVVPSEITTESVTVPHKLYVKVERANVRQCPLSTCDVIDTFTQNSWVTTAANSLAEAPEWIEMTYDADPAPGEQLMTGYINKITLAENPVHGSASGSAAGQPPSGGGGSTSSGGITIGPWADIRTTVGESYEFHFCEPPAAISGATCGGLAGATTDPRGGRPPYSFIKKSGFLPPGMALELNGTLKGTPTQEGTYNFKLCAKDLYGGEGCQNLAVIVSKTGTSPVSPGPSPVNPAGTLRYTVSFAAEGDADDDLVIGIVKYHAVFRGEPVTVDVPSNGARGTFEMPFTINVSIRIQPVSPHPVCIGNYPGYSATETLTGTVPGFLLVDPSSQRLKFYFEDLSEYVSDLNRNPSYSNCSNMNPPDLWRFRSWGIIRHPLDLAKAFPYTDDRPRTTELGGGTIEGWWESGTPQSTGRAMGGRATFTISPVE